MSKNCDDGSSSLVCLVIFSLVKGPRKKRTTIYLCTWVYNVHLIHTRSDDPFDLVKG